MGWRALPDGGRIRVVSVAGVIGQVGFARGIARIRDAGFRVAFDPGLLDTGHPYLAAEDSLRADDLVAAFLDPEVDAVLCARGGYGSMRLLGRFDARSLAETGKPFAGFSDITALHLALNGAGLPTLHAPVVTALGGLTEEASGRALDRLLRALQGRMPAEERLAGGAVAGGRAEGPLVGGNLSLLAACLPISWIEVPHGSILLIEEVAEPLYRIDRMLTGLKLAGLLEGFSGFALGSFSRCGGGPEGPRRAAEVAAECLIELDRPIVSDLPIGHGDDDLAVPLGSLARLDGGVGELALRWR